MPRLAIALLVLCAVVSLLPERTVGSSADYLKYLSCFQKLGEARGACGKKHQEYQEHARLFSNDHHNKKEKRGMCCKYSSYVNCYLKNVRRICGESSHKGVHKYIEHTTHKSVKDTCKKFDGHKCGASFGTTASFMVLGIAAITALVL